MKTEINTHRIAYTAKSTTGLWIADGEQWPCVSLEDRVRPFGEKLWGLTAIWPGRYRLSKRVSPHLKREVIWILDVPMFDYVYVHSLNTAEDTEGCVGIAGKRINWDKIFGDAFSWERKLFNYIESRGWDNAWLTITNGPGAEPFLGKGGSNV